jgi:hypothetical protein
MGTLDRTDLHRQVDALSPQLLDVVERSPDVMAGQPVVHGTRMPAMRCWTTWPPGTAWRRS